MNALSRTSLRNRLERVIGVVVVLSMVAAGVSSALASELPGAAGNQLSLAQDYDVVGCEAPLPQTALALLRSDAARYDLWRPAGWSVLGSGPWVVITPDGQSQGAYFSIQVMDTLNVMTIDDLNWRIERFNNLITDLPNAQVQWQAHWTDGNVTGLEAGYTFRDDSADTTTARWVRLLYVGTQQYWLVAQAPSTAEFDRSRLMFAAMMLTFRPDNQVQQDAAEMCIP
jgi:hypothetical protein